MRLASLAGIRVFVTGGLGGVHRGAATTFDVSADLTELSTTPVCVVSAGVKSILDIGLTLEMLETLGVPVLVDGSDEFPSFYSRSSGFAAPLRADGPDEIARAMDAAWSLGLTSGLVVAHPIPVADEIPASEIDPVIAQALADLDEHGIGGRDATPYLLGRIVELTDGASLTANIALVRENARVGAEIAVGTPPGLRTVDRFPARLDRARSGEAHRMGQMVIKYDTLSLAQQVLERQEGHAQQIAHTSPRSRHRRLDRVAALGVRPAVGACGAGRQ